MNGRRRARFGRPRLVNVLGLQNEITYRIRANHVTRGILIEKSFQHNNNNNGRYLFCNID